MNKKLKKKIPETHNKNGGANLSSQKFAPPLFAYPFVAATFVLANTMS